MERQALSSDGYECFGAKLALILVTPFFIVAIQALRVFRVAKTYNRESIVPSENPLKKFLIGKHFLSVGSLTPKE
jgi:hypothetical protein